MIFKPHTLNRQLVTKLQVLFASMFLLAGTLPTIAQHHHEQTKDSTEDNKVYMFVEEMPVFPGNLNAWIYSHVQYPEAAKTKGIEGKVYVRFIIEKDGTVNDVKIIRGVSTELDNEAKEVIASMPKWYPGKQNNTPVRVYYTVPVYFALKSTAPNVERRTFDKYLKALEANEAKLKQGTDTVASSSAEMYRLYLKKRYGSDKAAYKGLVTSAREQQQSSEIMLSIVMPSLTLPAEDKNMILKYYKEEWDEQIRLIDSLPEENFITRYVNITPRFQENKVIREIKIRDYLGLKKFKKYVEECIFSPGKLFRTIVANPLAGKWEKISENGIEVKHPIQKEFYDDFSFLTSDGTKGTYKITAGQLIESSQSVKVKDIIEYTATYQFEANNQILVLTGEAKLKLANGTLKNVQVKETWRRIE
ncbi:MULTISPECIES: energy transducer TonB [Butyricimonas]|uniref:energy transducer TonB n=1 Tax=Butyricimonas TaxID=574697 RepID=UPI001D08212F|nr:MULTISPECIES: energy transducer TonB [Butyricimonas]MCB6973485.1 energy transducer TonB [Butyricimonas synergistica]MCG4520411.1 energy transducer TonB [Butyricimonas sp. DFI.6.44]